jgi:hypothetical protein
VVQGNDFHQYKQKFSGFGGGRWKIGVSKPHAKAF